MPRFQFEVEIKASTQTEAYNKLCEVDGVDKETVDFMDEYPDETEEESEPEE